ncbi:hypothetical protein [Streptomyces sp. ODS28]|uniref:hypothetical protein n=1 Tax=Streptomyces sp. ODS28 TaxID=3136688 RepID=UPI0031EF3ABC
MGHTIQRRAGWSALAAAALTGLLTAGTLPTAATEAAPRAGGRYADARFLDLDIGEVGPLGTTGFRGSYGSAHSESTGQDSADYRDPDGVERYAKTSGQKVTRTSYNDAQLTADNSLTGLDLTLGDPAIRLLHIGTVHTHAMCVPEPYGPYAQAYVRTDSNTINVLGRQVPVGTTSLEVSGAELGHPDTLGTSTLKVSYEQHEDPPGGAAVRGNAATASVRITVTGQLRNRQGEVVYDGPITSMELGKVEARCGEDRPSPSPSASSSQVPPPESPGPQSPGPTDPTPEPSDEPSSETPAPTPTPSDTESPEPSPSGSATPTPSPTQTPTPTPSSTGSESVPPATGTPSTPSTPTAPSTPGKPDKPGPSLPDTGLSYLAAALLAGLLASVGLVLLYVSRGRRPE